MQFTCKADTVTLSLAGNGISPEASKVLVDALRYGYQFQKLDLTDCLIGDEGLEKFPCMLVPLFLFLFGIMSSCLATTCFQLFIWHGYSRSYKVDGLPQ